MAVAPPPLLAISLALIFALSCAGERSSKTIARLDPRIPLGMAGQCETKRDGGDNPRIRCGGCSPGHDKRGST